MKKPPKVNYLELINEEDISLLRFRMHLKVNLAIGIRLSTLYTSVLDNFQKDNFRIISKDTFFFDILITIVGKSDDDTAATIIGANYKFFLAFENILCYEYITEKVFQNMLEPRQVRDQYTFPLQDQFYSSHMWISPSV